MMYSTAGDSTLFPWVDWPESHMVPADAEAEAVAEYFARYRNHKHLPRENPPMGVRGAA